MEWNCDMGTGDIRTGMVSGENRHHRFTSREDSASVSALLGVPHGPARLPDSTSR